MLKNTAEKLKNGAFWLVFLMGMLGGVMISYASESWMAAVGGACLAVLTFFIGVVMGMLFHKDGMPPGTQEDMATLSAQVTKERAELLKEVDNILQNQRIHLRDAAELLVRGVGGTISTRMVEEMFGHLDNSEQVDSILKRAEDIVDEEVAIVYEKLDMVYDELSND